MKITNLPPYRQSVIYAREGVDLERWLRATLDTLSRKSDAAAVLYALKLWPALLRYCGPSCLD